MTLSSRFKKLCYKNYFTISKKYQRPSGLVSILFSHPKTQPCITISFQVHSSVTRTQYKGQVRSIHNMSNEEHEIQIFVLTFTGTDIKVLILYQAWQPIALYKRSSCHTEHDNEIFKPKWCLNKVWRRVFCFVITSKCMKISLMGSEVWQLIPFNFLFLEQATP